jgi:hypothetical protein
LRELATPVFAFPQALRYFVPIEEFSWEEGIETMKIKLMVVFGLLTLIVSGASLQADWVQCLGGVCPGTNSGDLINGSNEHDHIPAAQGDDVIFGNDGPDRFISSGGNDLLFGGNGSDNLVAEGDNDIVLPGPDDGAFRQFVSGGFGNDSMVTFASETMTCLFYNAGGGVDTATLVGFGPYSAQHPFGQAGFGDAYILEVDPIAGGNVLIYVSELTEFGAETIFGLTSPTPTIIPDTDPIVQNCPPVHPAFSP